MLNLYQSELASTASPRYPRAASLCLEYSNSSHLVNIYSSLKIQLQYHTLLEVVNTVFLLLLILFYYCYLTGGSFSMHLCIPTNMTYYIQLNEYIRFKMNGLPYKRFYWSLDRMVRIKRRRRERICWYIPGLFYIMVNNSALIYNFTHSNVSRGVEKGNSK